jgi:glycosyltransferase involved in cell wall biosynthesis
MSPRILCVDQFPALGGGQRCLLDLLPAFVERGWRVELALPGAGPFAEAAHTLGVRTHVLPLQLYSNLWKPPREVAKYATELPKVARMLSRIASSNQLDTFYVNGPRLLPAAALAAWYRRIPLVFHCHNRLQQSIAVRVTGQLLRLCCARVIGCCRYAVEPISPYIRRERLSIVYNGVAASPRGVNNLRENILRIGVIGRIEPEKGQMDFVLAARTIYHHFPNCCFSVIGAPMFSGRTYFDQVMEASRGLPVDFPGWKTDIPSVLNSLDLLVVPSTRLDATPRVIFEAFAAGVPVVALPVGGIPEIIEDGVTGFLAAEASSNSLADRVLSVLNLPPDDVRRVCRQALAAWERRHTLNRFQEQVCDVLARTARAA